MLVGSNFLSKKKTKILIICRTGSKRLPNKIKKKIKGFSLLEILILRLLTIFDSSDIVICTSLKENKSFFKKISQKYRVNLFFGSNRNVLKRMIDASKKFKIGTIIRITGDNPLTDTKILVDMLNCFFKFNVDYLYTNLLFPGLKSEIFKVSSLRRCLKICEDPMSSEYLTYYFLRKHTFKIRCFSKKKVKKEKNLSITIDDRKDFLILKRIIDKFGIYVKIRELIKNLPKSNTVKEVKKIPLVTNRYNVRLKTDKKNFKFINLEKFKL